MRPPDHVFKLMKTTVKYFIAWLFLLLCSFTDAQAHPSISIVVDSQGNIFYSDLTNVWIIYPDGHKEIAVPNVHTHELWLSPEDVLFGEDVTNSGDDYRHRLWSRQPDGSLQDEIPWRAGFPDQFGDYSFARDKQSRSYVLRREKRRIDVRSDTQVEYTIPLEQFPGHIYWLIAQADGVIYVAVGEKLLRIEPNSKEAGIIAQGLIERSKAFDFVQDRHAIMGLWSNNQGEVYVSVFSGQVVKHVAKSGKVTEVLRNEGDWSVSGGTIDRDGSLLLLEFSTANEVRVRRVKTTGESEEL